MERWQFLQSPTGEWYWLCSDVNSHRTRTSTATFKTESQCITDARGNGYQSGPSSGPRAKAKPIPGNRRARDGWK
jgi:hypothetical protein